MGTLSLLSKVVELLVERLDLLLAVALDHGLLLRVAACLTLVTTTLLLSYSNCHVKLSYLVSILTWSRYFDWPRPIEVKVAERVSQLLQVDLLELGLVHRHMEVRGEDTPLVGARGSHEEVKGS